MSRALLCVAFFSAVSAAKAPATQAELDTLAANGAWDEILERAEDVPAASRGEPWKTVVVSAATARVTHRASSAPEAFAAAVEADALKGRYRFLADREAFITARDAAVNAGAQRCMKDREDQACWKALAHFENTLSPAGGLALGRLFKKNGWLPSRVMPLLAKGISGADSALCKDPEVQDVTVAALDAPVEEASAAAARTVAFEWCWVAMQPKLRAAMVGASSYRLRNACKPMRERKALSALQLDLCADEEQ